MTMYNIMRLSYRKGMNQGELSKRVGITPQTLSRIINGRQNTSIRTIAKIAEVLEVPISILFDAPKEYHGICPNCWRHC